MLLVFLTRRYHLTRVNRWSDCIGYMIETVFQISILESLVKIPSSRLYEKKDGAFELTSLPPHPHVLLAFKSQVSGSLFAPSQKVKKLSHPFCWCF